MTSSESTTSRRVTAHRRASTRRILIVDDDKVFCKTLSAALRRRGNETLIAHSVKEGIEEAAAWKPDHAVVDLRMPGGDGLQLVEHLVGSDENMRVVVLTGYGSIRTAVMATKLGAIQYLTKPVSIDMLIEAWEGNFPEQAEEKPPSLEEVEREHLQRVLDECDGNVSEAARRLDMHRRTLQRKLARGDKNR